jgi:hypothetical protein
VEVPTEVEQIGVFALSAVSQVTLLRRALARAGQGEIEVAEEVDMGGGGQGGEAAQTQKARGRGLAIFANNKAIGLTIAQTRAEGGGREVRVQGTLSVLAQGAGGQEAQNLVEEG